MWIVGALAGAALIALMLVDGFETILQPRRITHRFRYTRLYFRSTWILSRAIAVRIPGSKKRQAFLSTFGPLSLLGLFATWIMGLIIGFALLHWSLKTPLRPAEEQASMFNYLYMSGTTFVTLGYGDITPSAPFGRTLAVVEAALGFGFLAVIIGYLPVMYQAYSRREVAISLMDARAGSPPSAAEVLLRFASSGNTASLDSLLSSWERWSAELLESHLSFPVLSFFRSQHDNQSWLATLTTVMDVCAILMTYVDDKTLFQAQLTFAMARHAAVDLALVLKLPRASLQQDRLPPDKAGQLVDALRSAGLALKNGPEHESKLVELRGMYEPFVNGLAERLMFAVPPILADQPMADNWQRSAWMPHIPGIGRLPAVGSDDEHF